MNESILKTIREIVTGSTEPHFDHDLIIFINSALIPLTQIGVGPHKGYAITDESSTWEELSSNNVLRERIKGYMVLKVGEMFDPTANSIIRDSKNKVMEEMLWRIREDIERP